MRILMICEDVEIDRRILLQARSLIEEGEEVLLLARTDHEGDFERYPSYEVKYGLKIFRVPVTIPMNKLQTVPYALQQKLVDGLNAKTAIAQEKINLFGGKIVKEQAEAAKNGQFVKKARLKLWQKFKTAIFVGRLKNWRAQAVFSYKAAQLSSKIGTVINGKPPLGHHYLQHALYFDPDVVHVHDLPQLPVGVQIKRKLNIPLIYDMHENYPLLRTLTDEQQKYLTRVETKEIKHVDKAIAVNPFAAKYVADTYKREMPAVIQNCTSPMTGFDRFAPHDDRIRKKLGIGEDKKILLFQGWVHSSRGSLKQLVISLKDVTPEVALVILGYGELDAIREIAREHGVEDRIYFLEPVPFDELLWWVASADAGMIPYIPIDNDFQIMYVSPNKLYEFIMAGLPMISNTLPFLEYVIKPNGFGVMGHFSEPNGFSEAINRAFANDGALLAEARENILRDGWKFGWENEKKILFQCYEDIGKPVGLSDAKHHEPVYPLYETRTAAK